METSVLVASVNSGVTDFHGGGWGAEGKEGQKKKMQQLSSPEGFNG